MKFEFPLSYFPSFPTYLTLFDPISFEVPTIGECAVTRPSSAQG